MTAKSVFFVCVQGREVFPSTVFMLATSLLPFFFFQEAFFFVVVVVVSE